MMRKSTKKTKDLVHIALFAALTAVLSQISIPLPSGIPVTLQTFAVAFAGCFLGWKKGLAAMAAYIALGAAGAPVFASFTGGAYKLVTVTGGFIWGFIPLVALAGAGAGESGRLGALFLAMCGLAACHMIGVGQFALVTGGSLKAAALTASVPYIVKDVFSVVAAAEAARTISLRLGSRKYARVGANILKFKKSANGGLYG